MSYRNRQFRTVRVRSAPPFDSLRTMFRPLEPTEHERIKTSARSGWMAEIQRNDKSVTTYKGLHARKDLDEPTSTRVRPSSPERMNKPHPPTVFLVTRLRKVKGCFDGSPKKDDGHRESPMPALRNVKLNNANDVRAQRRPSTSISVRDHKEREKIREVMGPRCAQATEAWMKLSSKRDAKRIKDAIDEMSHPEEVKTDRPLLQRRFAEDKHQNKVYASNRWLKRAGREENDAVSRLIEALKMAKKMPVPNEGPHFHITDYSSLFTAAAKKHHHDFQIHPEWHQPWHKQYE